MDIPMHNWTCTLLDLCRWKDSRTFYLVLPARVGESFGPMDSSPSIQKVGNLANFDQGFVPSCSSSFTRIPSNSGSNRTPCAGIIVIKDLLSWIGMGHQSYAKIWCSEIFWAEFCIPTGSRVTQSRIPDGNKVSKKARLKVLRSPSMLWPGLPSH